MPRLDRNLLSQGEFVLGQWATDVTTEQSSAGRKNLLFWASDFTSVVFAADAVTGNEVWRSPRFIGQILPDSVRFHDLANDGNLSISVAGAAGVTLSR